MSLKQQLLVTTVGSSYAEEVVSLVGRANIVAYWTLAETGGTTAANYANPGSRDGSYSGVTLADGRHPSGDPCPRFDGVNDVVDVYSASLNSAFPRDEGSLLAWFKVADAGVWTDSAHGYVAHFLINTWDKLWHILEHSNNNELWLTRTDTAGQKKVAVAESSTNWIQAGLTWSVSADAFKAYRNGAQAGSTLSGLLSLTGNLSASRCNIGADTNTPTSVFDGWIAHVLLASKVLTAVEIARLYKLGGGK